MDRGCGETVFALSGIGTIGSGDLLRLMMSLESKLVGLEPQHRGIMVLVHLTLNVKEAWLDPLHFAQ